MWPNITLKHIAILMIALILSVAVMSSISAQDSDIPGASPTDTPTLEPSPTPSPTDIPTATPTEVPQISVNGLQPTQLTQGVGGSVTISGSNFTSQTTVSLNGNITLPVTAQSANTLTASVSGSLTAGTYSVEVSDPSSGTLAAANSLTILAATAVPQLTVAGTEPSRITAGQSATLSVIGTNLTANTTVRLIGYGFLTTSFVNNTAITAALPANLPAGQYSIEVSDPANGTVTAPGSLMVAPVVATAAPAATATAQPTPLPGQPDLVVSNFNANPATIYAGGTTQLSFVVVNVGSRTAEGVVVALGSDSKFSPANGQSSITLPDLAAGASYAVSLSVTAPEDATDGSQNITLVLTSHDFSGQSYSDNGTVSVGVLAKPAGESQVVLDSYQIVPDIAAPGDTIVVKALFKNTGTKTASQVIAQLDPTSDLLIAGANGNAYSVGDMAAGSSTPVVMSFVVASDAKSGIQPQTLNISYLDDGNAKQATASFSLDVKPVVQQTPLVLLQSYDVGQDNALQPGQQFSLKLTLQNAGSVDVSDLLLTFGTVSSSDSGSSSTVASSSTTSSSATTTTNSDSFSIYGSGSTVLLGNLSTGKTVSISQDFIVSSDLTSGIQDLPITLQYQTSDGTTSRQSLDASLKVVIPPSLRVTTTKALDDPLTAGTAATLSLKISNAGDNQANLTQMSVAGDNVKLTDSVPTPLDPLASGDDVTKTITFTPQAAGTYTVTVTLDYVDDLNQNQTITQTYTGHVSAAQTQQTRQFNPALAAQQNTQNQNELGRLLLGFLGFGG